MLAALAEQSQNAASRPDGLIKLDLKSLRRRWRVQQVSLEAQRRAFEADRERVAQSHSLGEALTREVATAREAVDAERAAMAQSRAEIERDRTELARERDQAVTENARLQVDRQALQAERSELATQLESLTIRHQTESEALAAQRRALEEQWGEFKLQEAKSSDVQQRLADQWGQIFQARAELDSRQEKFARKQADLEDSSRRLAEQAESLKRQRTDLSARAAELAEQRERLNAEMKTLKETQSQTAEMTERLMLERTGLAQLREQLKRRKLEIVTEAKTPPLEFGVVQARSTAGPGDDTDPLERTRHNKVFRTERAGSTLLVTPLGDSAQFLYSGGLSGNEQSPSLDRKRRLLQPRCRLRKRRRVWGDYAQDCRVVIADCLKPRRPRGALWRQRKDAS